MLEIRMVCEDDLEQIWEIEKSAFSMPWSIQSFAESIIKENTIYLAAVDDSSVLGYCGMWKVLDEGEITNVAVKEDSRNQKIGRQLLSNLLKEGQKSGVAAFTLEVRESNAPAIRLYESLGFVNAGLRKNFYEKPVEHAVIMWKR